jgi:hypothetical protein
MSQGPDEDQAGALDGEGATSFVGEPGGVARDELAVAEHDGTVGHEDVQQR